MVFLYTPKGKRTGIDVFVTTPTVCAAAVVNGRERSGGTSPTNGIGSIVSLLPRLCSRSHSGLFRPNGPRSKALVWGRPDLNRRFTGVFFPSAAPLGNHPRPRRVIKPKFLFSFLFDHWSLSPCLARLRPLQGMAAARPYT
jgi:hypothetical protein